MTHSISKRDTVGRVYGGEIPAERVARRRQQFLDAGLQIFGTTGYRTATVRMLCKQAELTDRYFYESFGNMEDLLVAVYLQQFEQLQQAVTAQLMAKANVHDVMVPVRAGLSILYDMAEQPCVARVCWLEVLGISQRVDATYVRTFSGFAELVVSFARQRFPKWHIADDEARMLGLALIGAVSQMVTHWVLGNYRESKQTLMSASARVFEGVLMSIERGAGDRSAGTSGENHAKVA
jgi:AcrR family transcriptional regulator